MTELILFLFAGVGLLSLFVWLAWRTAASAGLREERLEHVNDVLELPGLRYEHATLLFDDRDFRYLQSLPRMSDVAKQLLRDRRTMALLWLRILRSDLNALWKLRRFLAQHGVSADLGEEFRVAASCALAHLLIASLRLAVFTAGPFAVAQGLRSARGRLARVGRSCEHLLALLPPDRLVELKQLWVPHPARSG
jgi:hypothetical protein